MLLPRCPKYGDAARSIVQERDECVLSNNAHTADARGVDDSGARQDLSRSKQSDVNLRKLIGESRSEVGHKALASRSAVETHDFRERDRNYL